MNTDILIAGSGCSGLYCALHLPADKNVTVITKSELINSNSYLAQGGICVMRDENDFESFYEDTMKAGHYENSGEAVSLMIKSSRDVIDDLVSYGADFAKNSDGSFNYTREGAHSNPRILYHQDVTGKEITSSLLNEASKRNNITLLERTTLLDIITDGNKCIGAVISKSDGTLETVSCSYTVLACGGIGGLFRHSTNFRHLTGDAVAIALNHGVKTKNLDYIQIHPTTLYSDEPSERSFLISESVRGEGAKLYDKNMNRFVNELLPRDLLSAAIREQMQKDGTEHVWEDLRTIPEDELVSHFPNIIQHCLEKNFDVKKECIPVVPAQHYFMGGIEVDTNSSTSMESLYAIGETACNGVHGKNRLASNSLLESLVFAKRAALHMTGKGFCSHTLPEIDLSKYDDRQKLEEDYKNTVLSKIRSNKNV